ncbi:hypothetical protein [Caulobacter sp. S45]|uniref:hypothetical protein n=1 Tax=Caulobacter sp. S45 TaxID=1641861 RepID=UPI00131E006C|nr:hypothetical protein [Caulobacter sp. S45]
MVKAAGGVEACAIELGISGERVSQLQRPTCLDQMSLLCISQLEAVIGRAIVTGAAARAAQGETFSPIAVAVVSSVMASAAALRVISEMDRDGRRDAREICDVQKAAQENLRLAQALADTAGRLQLGSVA